MQLALVKISNPERFSSLQKSQNEVALKYLNAEKSGDETLSYFYKSKLDSLSTSSTRLRKETATLIQKSNASADTNDTMQYIRPYY